MFARFFSIWLVAAVATFWTGGLACASSLNGANIFTQLSGTTTITKGGNLASQARSIYSLGGGQTSFQGKQVTLFSADPPTISAGCSGISWHFGGFSFISVSEIGDLVSAVAQSSMGVVVDLAMQTLCPQCYAVMSKLRDIANAMRNASANACKIAENLGAQLKASNPGLFSPTVPKAECSSHATANITNMSDLEAQFTSTGAGICSDLTSVASYLGNEGTALTNFLNGTAPGAAGTPNKKTIDNSGNITYEVLTALGYQDGFIKDLLLSYLGMEIQTATPAANCSAAFAALYGTAPSGDQTVMGNAPKQLDFSNLGAIAAGTARAGGGSQQVAPPAGAQTFVNSLQSVPATTGTDATAVAVLSKPLCVAPPILSTDDIGSKFICGVFPQQDLATFTSKFVALNASLGASILTYIQDSGLGSLCNVKQLLPGGGSSGTAVAAVHDNPPMWHCDASTTNRCMIPQQTTMQQDQAWTPGNAAPGGYTAPTGGQYTGLAWYVLDALYSGVYAVGNNQPLPIDTIRILNSTDYPLYRIINLAAVYPGMAGNLLTAYGGVIAIHYGMDTLTKLMMTGTLPQISIAATHGDVTHEKLYSIRSQIENMIHVNDSLVNDTMKRMAEKRALVDVIMQVNKQLQAEVITDGLNGNANVALNIKNQIAHANPVAPSTATGVTITVKQPTHAGP